MSEKLQRLPREFVVIPSLPKPVFEKCPDLSTPIEYEKLKFPPWLQERIVVERDKFIHGRGGVFPNVLVLQDSWIVSAQFYRDELIKEPKDQWVQDKIIELYEKLKKWQGQMLFEWGGLKIYNRHHVIGNRDLPMIFLEVKI
jgi:hypothetical protein